MHSDHDGPHSHSRRSLLAAGAASLALLMPRVAAAQATRSARQLILIELRGGNDGLNTIVPANEGRYFDLRPQLALRGEALTPLADCFAMHASLARLRPLWDAGEMSVIHGVGYAQPNLSHFRSIDIWDTASRSDEVLQQGWLTRAAARSELFRSAAADGAVFGSDELGPLAGGARAVAMTDAASFGRRAQLARPQEGHSSGLLAHLLRVEADIARARGGLVARTDLGVEFPRGAFGRAMQGAAELAAGSGIPVLRVSLNGFDTHQNQLNRHAALLGEVAEAVVALRAALLAAGTWERSLVLTTSEFGRRPQGNGSGGSDHGTAAPMLAFGPRLRGGMHGDPPSLAKLDSEGNLRHTTELRDVFAAVLAQWWDIDPASVLGSATRPIALLRA
jgi:uncharacterized protein (DUF1501 family)